MAEIDTSSYPKAGAGKSALETAAQFGAIKQQSQAIEKTGISIAADKLKLLNEHFGIMNKELSNMANDPNITKDQVMQRLDGITKMLNMPQPVRQQMFNEFQNIRTPQELKQKLETALQRGMTTQEQINFAYGTPGTLDTGQTQQPVVTSVRPGFGMKGIAPPVQHQLPPVTPTVEPGTGQPRMLGAQPYQPPPGPLPVGPVTAPGVKGSSSNFGGNVTGAEVGPNLPVQPLTPSGPATAPTPMFEEGKKALAADQELATQKLTSIKPAIQTLPYLKDIMAGPGTDGFTKAVAALKGFGILTTQANDPTAIRQEVVKKLAQYVASNPAGQRSDASQTLAEAASPSPGTQITPALIKLTKDSIVLDRVQAARANAFEGQDYSKYGKHRSTFPASIDERAFGLDLMEPEERKKLAEEMFKKKNTFEGKKFWKSYKIVRDQDLIDTSGF